MVHPRRLLGMLTGKFLCNYRGASGWPFEMGQEEMMKRLSLFGAVAILAILIAPAGYAQGNSLVQSNQIVQGTQIKLVLLNGLSTSVARSGDPFTALVSEPVFLGNQLLIPAGAKVQGQVGDIIRSRHFSIFRQQAAMNLNFRSIEVNGREVPAKISVLSIYKDSTQGTKLRKDLKLQEGELVEEKRDLLGDAADLAIGGAGGTVAGAVFSHVIRGFGIGMIGGAAYVIQKKGKDVELPAQTNMLVRLDAPVSLPATVAQAQQPYVGYRENSR